MTLITGELPLNAPLIQMQHAVVRFDGLDAIQDVSLAIESGEIVTLIGPNGAGKTTLVKAILGLQPLSSGSVTRQPGLRIGYVPQKIQIQPTLPLTVKRFLALTGAPAARCVQALEHTGAAKTVDRSMHQLSGGEQQRVMLARAILRQPQLLVLDEPAQGVDVAGQAALYSLIRTLRDELGCGVLMISHDLHLIMAATDRVICLNRHICCSGKPEQVSGDPAFNELFGERVATSLAVYHHHHNHQHDLHGAIVPGAGCDHPEHHHE